MFFKVYYFVAIFIVSLIYSRSSLAKNIIINNPVITNWGSWGLWQKCPNDTYVVAFQLKTEDYIGSEDDTALNGVRLYCDKPGENGIDKYITSSFGAWGAWGQVFYCEGLLTGFQMRSEEYLSRRSNAIFSVDNTAANNLKGFCATSNIKNSVIEGDGQVWGSWTRAQNCLPRQAICGIQTQVEKYIGSEDDTALNNIKMECCDIPDPARACIPTDKWELLIECDNSEGLVPLKCTFERKNGISASHSDSSTEFTESRTLIDVGFSIDYISDSLSSNFKTNLQTSTVTQHNWKTESSQTWSEESAHKAEFEVNPGMISSLYQVVGKCRFYDVFTLKFRKKDEVKATNVTVDKVFVWNQDC